MHTVILQPCTDLPVTSQGDHRLPSETVLADMAALQGWAPHATKVDDLMAVC